MNSGDLPHLQGLSVSSRDRTQDTFENDDDLRCLVRLRLLHLCLSSVIYVRMSCSSLTKRTKTMTYNHRCVCARYVSLACYHACTRCALTALTGSLGPHQPRPLLEKMVEWRFHAHHAAARQKCMPCMAAAVSLSTRWCRWHLKNAQHAPLFKTHRLWCVQCVMIRMQL